ncbi:MBG domain-containing protein [Flavobacterium phycosphaerae]|uniref:MBG domain-containing protein n=1 Tax=Flavobacterium phycosphaerae TaxID=2697515 RepID=UPI00138AF596|nr:MBG domain-containing protein [Flavobacterium phycosphaerae]
MKLILCNPKSKLLFFFLFLVFSSNTISAANYRVTAISVGSQSTTVTYGTVSSTTYTLTLSEIGNGNPASTSILSINWTPPTGVTVSGLGTINLTGDGQTVTFTVTTSANTPAGTTSFTISSTNYAVTSSGANFVVSKRSVTITANNASKPYGTTQSTPVTGATAFTVSGLAGSETIGSVTLSYSGGAISASSSVGSTSSIIPNTAVGGTFTASNYTITYVNGTLTVVKATPTVTPTIGTYTYDATAQGPNSATNTGSSTSYTYSYIGTGTTSYGPSATRPSNAGTYTVTVTVASNTNYNSASSVATAFTIQKAALTITASNASKSYGTTYTLGSVAFSATGLLSGQTIGGVTLTSTGAVSSAAVGAYLIVPSAATGGTFNVNNYTITYVNGTLTVVKATPTVTPTIGTYTYNATAQGPNSATNTGSSTSYTYSYTGTGTTTYGPSAIRPSNAGTYTVTVTVDTNTNYNSASSAATAFTIQKAVLTITASNASKSYGTTYALGTSAFSATGLLGGQTIGGVTLTSSGAVSSAAVGTYPIVPSAATGGTFNAVNYTITYTNGTLTVSTGSSGGVISGDSSICSGSTATLVLSGYIGNVIRWEYGVSPYTTWSTIANTSTTYTTTALTQTTQFRAVVQNGSSPAVISTIAAVTVGNSTSWDGNAWSNGTPDASKAVVLAGAYTSNGTNIEACSLTVNNNAVVTIASGDSVTLSGAVTVASGSSLTFQNNANLIQSGTTNTNSGTVIIKRESAMIKRLDYTLWSSPVSGQQLQAFSPQTMSNRFYSYNSATNVYDQIVAPSTINFETAKGYLIRASNTQSATELQPWLGQFTGVPNNGNYTFTLTGTGVGNRFNLIGNPYPSPIYADDFINNANNAVTITGTLYFWRKINGSLTPSYCTLTPLGGFVSNGHPSANAFGQNPNIAIEPGQGFFVEATGNGNGTVQFTNSMRTNSHNNLFLKAAAFERNRIWLNATTTNGAFSQMMVGYLTNATQGVDNYIDGKYINDGEIALTSLIGTTPYAIQGRALPFDAGDVVPMSFKTATAGDCTIAIDHSDGFFSEGQEVYLRDNVTGTVHNLSSGGYTFTSEAGTFDTRFELLYQLPLGVSNPQFNASQVVIYRDAGNNLIINTGNESMATVKIFDINGKLILEKRDIHNAQTSMFIGLSNEVVLVQITSESGTIVTKKYLLQRMTLKKDKPALEKTQIANDE